MKINRETPVRTPWSLLVSFSAVHLLDCCEALVSLTLEFTFPSTYPDVVPIVKAINRRGCTDYQLQKVEEKLITLVRPDLWSDCLSAM